VLLFLLTAAPPRKDVAFDYRIRFSVLPSQEDPGLTLLPSKRLAGKSVLECKSLRGAIGFKKKHKLVAP